LFPPSPERPVKDEDRYAICVLAGYPSFSGTGGIKATGYVFDRVHQTVAAEFSFRRKDHSEEQMRERVRRRAQAWIDHPELRERMSRAEHHATPNNRAWWWRTYLPEAA
jgi:hypothetical protein